MSLIEEIVVPTHRFDQSIHIEQLQRVVTGQTGVSGAWSHIRVIMFEFVFFEDFLVDQEVTHASVFHFFSDEILHIEASDSTFHFVVSGSTGSEHDPLVRVEALTEHAFIEIASSEFTVSHQLEVFEVESLLKIDVSLVLIGESGNERFQESIDLSCEAGVAQSHRIDLSVFVTILLEKLSRGA